METEFGKIAKKIRMDNEEILADMAARLEVSPSFLSAVENGKSKVPKDWLDKITKEYELDISWPLYAAIAKTNNQISIDLTSVSDEGKDLAVAFARAFGEADAESTTHALASILGEYILNEGATDSLAPTERRILELETKNEKLTAKVDELTALCSEIKESGGINGYDALNYDDIAQFKDETTILEEILVLTCYNEQLTYHDIHSILLEWYTGKLSKLGYNRIVAKYGDIRLKYRLEDKKIYHTHLMSDLKGPVGKVGIDLSPSRKGSAESASNSR
jgi:transcriptional regulator with XRE-family HTH domain